jgi:hypothetical protein
MMGLVAGALLLVFAYSATFTGLWHRSMAIEEIVKKRPDLADVVYHPLDRWVAERLYKQECPQGTRMRKAWACYLLGMAMSFPGLILVFRGLSRV